MSLERRVMLALAGTGMVIVSGPAVLNISTNPYLREAVFLNRVDCGNSADALDPNHPYDAVVVPGGGTIKDPNGNAAPNSSQRIRLQAAAVALTKGFAPRVVLLDGATEPGDSQSSGNKYLVGEVQNHGKELPPTNILSEEQSVNTATNMQELAKIARDHNLRRVAVVTNKSHSKRATMLACINGVPASSISAEYLLGKSEETFSSPFLKFTTHLKEHLEVAFLMWDPNGTIPTFIRRLMLSLS